MRVRSRKVDSTHVRGLMHIMSTRTGIQLKQGIGNLGIYSILMPSSLVNHPGFLMIRVLAVPGVFIKPIRIEQRLSLWGLTMECSMRLMLHRK